MIVRKKTIIAPAMATMLLITIAAACGGASDTGGGSSAAGEADRRPAAGAGKDAEKSAESPQPAAKGVPELLEKGLQSAQDQAKQAGFKTESHDATPRSRAQVLDKDWKVCFQEPEAGTELSTGTKIRLGVVKLSEECPKTDQSLDKPTLGPDKRLPDFAGRNLAEVGDALGNDASIDPVDATGDGRNIFLEKNWQICSQDPRPGTEWDGKPITVKVVKYDEECP